MMLRDLQFAYRVDGFLDPVMVPTADKTVAVDLRGRSLLI